MEHFSNFIVFFPGIMKVDVFFSKKFATERKYKGSMQTDFFSDLMEKSKF